MSLGMPFPCSRADLLLVLLSDTGIPASSISPEDSCSQSPVYDQTCSYARYIWVAQIAFELQSLVQGGLRGLSAYHERLYWLALKN